jgi:hypothetical protein
MLHPVTIETEALYDDGSLYQALGLTPTTLANARRAGSLRFTRQGKRTLYKGAWILAWLDSKAGPSDRCQTPHTRRHEAAGQEGGHED